jgi:hypothetical protein
MPAMSNSSTGERSSDARERPPAEPPLRARRCECQRCHAHTFLVLRTLGEAKCSVCQSYDLVPLEV